MWLVSTLLHSWRMDDFYPDHHFPPKSQEEFLSSVMTKVTVELVSTSQT